MSKRHPKSKVKLTSKKAPAISGNIHTKKQPKIASPPVSTNGLRPAWRMGMIDFDGPWGWSHARTVDVFKTIQERLKYFETMTWGEIERKHEKNGHPQNHFMPTSKICKEAKDRLKQLRLDDRDELYSLRFMGLQRIWGIRDAETLYIIWWDPDHTVYPVPKSHS